MIRTFLFVILILISNSSISQEKNATTVFGQWHTTHGLDKFPCMDKKEEEYFKKLIQIHKIEEKISLLEDHRKSLKPNKRSPASVSPQSITKTNFICPPFRGVRNPYPQVLEFGKASTFEHIRITNSNMKILNGLNRNEAWPIHFSASKGYFEGKTTRGTPINIIPLEGEQNQNTRFVVQYLLWQDKTAPTLTLCYREDLHNQCNPYAPKR